MATHANLNVGLPVGTSPIGPLTLVAATGRYQYLGPPPQYGGTITGSQTLAASGGSYAVSGASIFGTNYAGVCVAGPEANNNSPFLNVFKSAVSYHAQSQFTRWYTSVASGGLDTNEEQYLQLDTNGYVKSLTAGNGFSGTQAFNAVTTLLQWALTIPPGATIPYPTGPYTLRWQGKGTLNFSSGDFTIPSQTTQSGVTISGNTVTSTNAVGTVNQISVNCTPTSAGQYFQITSIPDTNNYPQALELVETAYLSNWLAGELYHPLFKSSLSTAVYQRLRFLSWTRNSADGGDSIGQLFFTATVNIGATSATFSSGGTTSGGTWPYPSGSNYTIVCPKQTLTATCTYGSSTIHFNTPITTALTANIPTGGASPLPHCCFMFNPTWANRSTLGSCSWTLDYNGGVPWEACIALCNEIGADFWPNQSVSAGSGDSSYSASLAYLAYSGNGANLAGSYITSFSGLNSTKKSYVEWGNEPWDAGKQSYTYSLMMGYGVNGNTGFNVAPEYMGTQVGAMGAAWATVFGASFSSRVVVCMSAYGGGTSNVPGMATNIILAMNAPDFVATGATAPYIQGQVGAIIYAPYATDYGMNTADLQNLCSVPDFVGEWYSLMLTNVGATTTHYTSLPSAGWAGAYSYPNIAGFRANVSAYSWGNLPWIGYETGTQFFAAELANLQNPYLTTWLNGMTAVARDPRAQYMYYDPTFQLWPASGPAGYWPALAANGMQSFNQFDDCSPPGVSGQFGAIESIMQSLSPAPYKYQGIANYIAA